MLRIACVLLLALCTIATVRAAGLPADALDCPYDYVNTSWTCPDGIGFDKWTCQPGASPQSPIDLPISFGEALNHFTSVARGAIDVSFDDNVTSDVTFPASGGVSFDNVVMTSDVPDTDELLGFNVRIPSEHTFDGDHANIEFQFVYYNSNSSRYVIVAILANITYTGAISPGIKAIHDALNSNSLSDNSVFSADLSDLKDGQSFWSYSGSFTTPPCGPADWLVAATLQRISEPVFFDFGNFISANNTLGQTIATPPRPTQPINGRSAVFLDPATSRSNSGNWKVAVGVSAALLGVIFIILIIGAVVFRN